LQGSPTDGIPNTGVEGVHAYPLSMAAYFLKNANIRLSGYLLWHDVYLSRHGYKLFLLINVFISLLAQYVNKCANKMAQ
jgi:hypothetical protein